MQKMNMTPILRHVKNAAVATRPTLRCSNTSVSLRHYSSRSLNTFTTSKSSTTWLSSFSSISLLRRSFASISNIESGSAPEPIIRRPSMTDSDEAAKELLRKNEFQRKIIVWTFVVLYCGYLAYLFTEFRDKVEEEGKATAVYLRKHKHLLNPELEQIKEMLEQPFLVKIDDDSQK